MAQKPTLPQGTRDFNPLQVHRRKFILNTIEEVFKKYGFMPLETPAMENLNTLTGKYGDEGDQLLFKVLNSGNYLKNLTEYNNKGLLEESRDKTLLPSSDGSLNNLNAKTALPYISEKGLRYDLTVPFARYVVMNRNEITYPFKRYQMQPVWRADRPQQGRYREFWQCDADVIGSNSLLSEAEFLKIYDEVFTRLEIPVVIKINNRKLLSALAALTGSPEKFMDITIAIDKLDKIGESGVAEELKKCELNESQISQIIKFLSLAQSVAPLKELQQLFVGSTEGLQGCNELKKVFDLLMGLQLQNPVKIDVTLARGLSYYTGAIVEVQCTQGDFMASIGGGGRYDNLTGIFGLPDVSGVGISFGLDRIYLVMENLQKFPDYIKANHTKILFCYFDEPTQAFAFAATAKIREAGIAAEIYPDIVKKIGKQLEYANKLNIPFVGIVGSNEMESGKVVIKNLKEGTQEEMSIEKVIEKLKDNN
ncbi:MAG: histidine--tRNA ligase [Bacteroidia bacterium]|nr:histidine--tRNA ligase [Bacteroidia bacterium]